MALCPCRHLAREPGPGGRSQNRSRKGGRNLGQVKVRVASVKWAESGNAGMSPPSHLVPGTWPRQGLQTCLCPSPFPFPAGDQQPGGVGSRLSAR